MGEASNPGPPVVRQVAFKSRVQAADATVKYPPPGDGCLTNCVAPGHGGGASGRSTDEPFQLTVETVNPTGWSALKRRLATTSAHALLAQETWVDQAAVAGASAWARKRGWRSIWSPALNTRKGGTAAGVAIFARDFLGLHFPPEEIHEIVPARAVMGVLEAPGSRPIRLISCYLKHGKGACTANAATLASIGAVIERCGDDEPCIAGGDYNMPPEELLGTEVDRRVSATLFCPDTERGTYRTAKAKSTIDYFLISDRVAAAVDDVATVEGSGVKGYVPVHVMLKPKMTSLRALHIRAPPKLATERVYGPLPMVPDWCLPRTQAKAALEAARADAADVGEWLERAYASWADRAEEELEGFIGVQLPKKVRDPRGQNWSGAPSFRRKRGFTVSRRSRPRFGCAELPRSSRASRESLTPTLAATR